MITLDLAEPDVALTDLLLAAECATFVVLLRRRGRDPLRSCFVGIFACIGLASLLGAVLHGFLAPGTAGYRLLWSATLVALAAMTAFVLLAGARLLLAAAHWRPAIGVAIAVFVAASSMMLFVDAGFRVVVAIYVPGIVWLAAGYVVESSRRQARGRLWAGFVGLLLTLVAAGIQQARVALHPSYFDHNALYHTVQALALLLVFTSTRALPAPPTTGEPCVG